MIQRVKRKLLNIWRHSAFGRVRKEQDAVRWGIIGLGYMAETFANAIDGNKKGYVAAVASRSLDKAKKFARRHGRCKSYGSYDDMLKDSSLELDIVYVATPVKCHFDNVKLCLEHGKNVLCEKPITFTARQLEELQSIARANNCFLMEGMWMKCLPSFRKAKQWIAENEIGQIEFIKADFYKRELIRPGYSIYNKNDGGGVIHDFGVYALAFITEFLGGEPDEVVAQSHYSAKGIDTDWQIMASRDGRKASVNLSSDFGSLSKAAVIGPRGFIEWDSQFNRTNCVKLFDSNGKLRETFRAEYRFDGFEFEVEEVQDCIKAHRLSGSIVPIEQSLANLRLMETLLNHDR